MKTHFKLAIMKTNERPHKSLERNKGTFFRLGLVVSLLITFFAFEWKTPVPREEILTTDPWENIAEESMPVTYRKQITPERPSKPIDYKRQAVVSDAVVVIPDDVLPTTVAPIDSLPIDDIIPIDFRKEIDTTEVTYVFRAEIDPEFPGGLDKLQKYFQNNTRYPETARRKGLAGTVYVTFIIDEYGKPINLECKGGADKVFYDEAMRVVREMPLWKPGQMGTKKVKVLMTMPVAFRLL